MFKLIRRKGFMKKILWLIAGVMILSLGLWSQAYNSTNTSKASYPGKIFGHKVTAQDFERNYQMINIQLRLQYGKNFEEALPLLNPVAGTWDRLILLHEAQRRRIRVKDPEVVQALEASPIFQRDGHFDAGLYQDILRFGFRVTPRQFEEGTRDSLKIAKLFQMETADVEISDSEVLKAYQKAHEEIQVSYVLFSAEAYTDQVTFDETKAKAFYEDNKTAFSLPPTLDVAYLTIPYPPRPEAATENPDADTEPAPWPPSEVKNAAWEKAENVRAFLEMTPDLTQAQEKFQLTAKTVNLNMEQPALQPGWTYPLVQKIFALSDGEISDVLETDIGLQIIQMKDKRPSFTPDYEQAQAQVKEAWLKNEALNISKEKTVAALKNLQQVWEGQKRPDFGQIVKDQGLEAVQTPVFTRGQYLPAIGISKDFEKAAFSLTEDQPLSGVVATPKGYAFLHLDMRTPLDEAQYAKDKASFQTALLEETRATAFNDFLARLRIKADLEDLISEKTRGRP